MDICKVIITWSPQDMGYHKQHHMFGAVNSNDPRGQRKEAKEDVKGNSPITVLVKLNISLKERFPELRMTHSI